MSQVSSPRRLDRARTVETLALNVHSPRTRLVVDLDDFWQVCVDNPELNLERSARGEILVTPPVGTETGNFNGRLTQRLGNWADSDRTGLFFDSSAGYTLPDGAVRSPDASWVLRERWLAVPAKLRKKFAPICPDFAVESTSPTDARRRGEVRQKMRRYLLNGARLGWLLDTDLVEVEIYRPARAIEVLRRPATLSGEDVLPGFVLDLRGILFD